MLMQSQPSTPYFLTDITPSNIPVIVSSTGTPYPGKISIIPDNLISMRLMVLTTLSDFSESLTPVVDALPIPNALWDDSSQTMTFLINHEDMILKRGVLLRPPVFASICYPLLHFILPSGYKRTTMRCNPLPLSLCLSVTFHCSQTLCPSHIVCLLLCIVYGVHNPH